MSVKTEVKQESMGTKINEQIDAQESKEVKEDQDVEETTDSEDTQEESSTSDNTDGETEDETDDDSKEESEDETDDEDVDDYDKQVAGKQAQLDKLDAQIVERRKTRRELREEEPQKQDVFVDKNDDLLADVAQSDIELIEKVVQSKGYVKAEDNYKTQLDSYKDAWLEKHPDYQPENDPEDELWNALSKELNTFYKAPANPKDITKILNKIDRDINPKSAIPVKSRATTNAAKQKLKASGKGGGGKGKTAPSRKNSTVDRASLHGFTDEELSEMGL